jgi:hypothetical protein
MRPYTGTFVQTDPIPGADANAYGYTAGDPVNETDLSGKSGGPLPLPAFCQASMHPKGSVLKNCEDQNISPIAMQDFTLGAAWGGAPSLCTVVSGGRLDAVCIGGLLSATGATASTALHGTSGNTETNALSAASGCLSPEEPWADLRCGLGAYGAAQQFWSSVDPPKRH